MLFHVNHTQAAANTKTLSNFEVRPAEESGNDRSICALK